MFDKIYYFYSETAKIRQNRRKFVKNLRKFVKIDEDWANIGDNSVEIFWNLPEISKVGKYFKISCYKI
jgi:hypothetical protein